MGIFFDIIGALVIRGTMVVIIISLTLSLHATLNERTMQARLKQNLAMTTDILKTDFSMIGHGVSTAGTAMLAASSTDLRFRADIDDNGIMDTVYYYLGPVAELATTENPNDRIIYRRVNQQTAREVGRGITTLSIIMYDVQGRVTATLANARSVQIGLIAQAGAPVERGYVKRYPTSSWELRFYPPNL
ncbi:MAG: hypothetical protein FJ215_08615 [Ignavibacteria bacterium]|nr:hypothetical protein [Ignavibacteria bacterium]